MQDDSSTNSAVAAAALHAFGGVVDLCCTSGCRRQRLLNHFGEQQQQRQRERCCDHCDDAALVESALQQLQLFEQQALSRRFGGQQGGGRRSGGKRDLTYAGFEDFSDEEEGSGAASSGEFCAMRIVFGSAGVDVQFSARQPAVVSHTLGNLTNAPHRYRSAVAFVLPINAPADEGGSGDDQADPEVAAALAAALAAAKAVANRKQAPGSSSNKAARGRQQALDTDAFLTAMMKAEGAHERSRAAAADGGGGGDKLEQLLLARKGCGQQVSNLLSVWGGQSNRGPQQSWCVVGHPNTQLVRVQGVMILAVSTRHCTVQLACGRANPTSLLLMHVCACAAGCRCWGRWCWSAPDTGLEGQQARKAGGRHSQQQQLGGLHAGGCRCAGCCLRTLCRC